MSQSFFAALSRPSQIVQQQAAITLERQAAYREGFQAAVTAGVKELKRVAKAMPPVVLADGTLGYPIRWPRTDDCFASTLATCLQVPIQEVPDPRLDEQLDAGETPDEINRRALSELAQWLDRRHLKMIVHRKVPVNRRRWIGVVELPGAFNSHGLVMDRDELLFDPINPPLTQIIEANPDLGRAMKRALEDRPVRLFEPEQITYGLSFQRITTNTTH